MSATAYTNISRRLGSVFNANKSILKTKSLIFFHFVNLTLFTRVTLKPYLHLRFDESDQIYISKLL